MTTLTPIEFSEFNLKSRIKLLKKDGELVRFKEIDSRYKLFLYSVYGFHVQCTFDLTIAKITEARIVISKNWLTYHNVS